MNEIIRGTTPTLRFTYDSVEVANITVAYITIKQGNDIIIEKDLSSASVGENYLEWRLSQEETLELTNWRTSVVDVQCRFKLADGNVGASKIYSVEVYKILKDGEI